jgi:transcriptional regulator with XRE-family HTH domain
MDPTPCTCHVAAVARSPRPDPALAAAVRRLREEHDVTIEALAYRANITSSSLARIELAQASPGWDTVRRIMDALGLSVSQLAKAVEAAEAENARQVSPAK